MSEISKLEPKRLWEIFDKLCEIPRPSKKEAEIIAFVKQFGLDLGLETNVDKVGNILIRKPATSGMENKKVVVLQGHLDMVPQKNSDVDHDFDKDPIQPFIDGDWVTAKGTTLGADNGIGVAAALAVLESGNLEHGPVEALFTVDEETGMTGAFGLQPGFLKGDILINMDSEDEGELYIGCAGGMDANVSMNYEEEKVSGSMLGYKLSLTGLKGGHSGMDINSGRANANILLARFIRYIERNSEVRVAWFAGGDLRNAIPRESFAHVVFPADKEKSFLDSVSEFETISRNEFSVTEPDLAFKAEKSDVVEVMDTNSQRKFFNAVHACPNGVIRMSDSMQGLVETSTNMAVVKVEDGKAMVQCLMRSSVDTAKDNLAQRIQGVFELAGAEVKFAGAYPGWKPNPDSPILKVMQDVYNNMYGKVPEIKAIHAGLECGLLGGVYPHLDMISFGPTIRYPHSPDEKVNIETVKKFWDFLVETLKNIPGK